MKAAWKGIGQYLNIVNGDDTSQDCTCSYSEYMITAIGRVNNDFVNYVASWCDVMVEE